MKHTKPALYWTCIILILVAGLITGCQQKTAPTADQKEILEKGIDLFARVKVNDFAVIYRNEFPYLQDRMPLEEYLEKYTRGYNPDSLDAIQMDSVKVWNDTAYIFMQLEYVHADSTYTVNPIRLRWYKMPDGWIKPSLSRIDKQEEFEEEIRMYLDAIKEREGSGDSDK